MRGLFERHLQILTSKICAVGTGRRTLFHWHLSQSVIVSGKCVKRHVCCRHKCTQQTNGRETSVKKYMEKRRNKAGNNGGRDSLITHVTVNTGLLKSLHSPVILCLSCRLSCRRSNTNAVNPFPLHMHLTLSSCAPHWQRHSNTTKRA